MQKIDDSMFEIQTTLFSIPALILLVYNAYQISKRSNLILFCSLCISIGFLFYLYRKIIKLIDENEKLKLGYEAELAIGQELNQLMRFGFYVFHDVNLKNTVSEFNIDHIVVGSSGVLAVVVCLQLKQKVAQSRLKARVTMHLKLALMAKNLYFQNMKKLHLLIKPGDKQSLYKNGSAKRLPNL